MTSYGLAGKLHPYPNASFEEGAYGENSAREALGRTQSASAAGCLSKKSVENSADSLPRAETPRERAENSGRDSRFDLKMGQKCDRHLQT